MKKQQSKRVIPGFGLTMGVTLAMLSIVVLIPLASLAVYSARLGFREFIEVITRPRVLSGFYVSFITAFAATVINAIMGLVLAWVLVRYDFPGKRIMDGMIELPFALPTAVAGISLTSLTSDKGLVGSFFANFGIKIAYTRIGITVALIFVGIPFVVRAIQPVLEKLDGSYEEAARVMGAKPFTVFRRVILPDPVWCESGAGKKYETYQREGCIMDEKKKQASGPVKWILIGISVIFLFVMLVLPLVVVVTQALSKGWQCYVQAVTDEYTLKALKLTIEATAAAVVCNTIFGLCAAWAMTRFHFRGKKLLTTLIDVPVTVSPVIAGLIYILVFGKQSPLYSVLESAGIQIVFAVPGIILATIFVTFPFVSREIIPVLESIGSDEEEAAALMGAKGWTIFTKVTFPHIKWAFLYGVVLCTARAMGEFGAVSVLSGHLRGKTNTLPLHVEILYNEFQYVPAFAVSSILVILAVILLIARNVLEHKGKGEKGDVR